MWGARLWKSWTTIIYYCWGSTLLVNTVCPLPPSLSLSLFLTHTHTHTQKWVSSLEAILLPLNEHFHILHPASGKKVSKVKNSTIPNKSNGSVSTDTQGDTSFSDEEGNQEGVDSPDSSKQPPGKQGESTTSPDNGRPSDKSSEIMNSPESHKNATSSTIPSPTTGSSPIKTDDGRVGSASTSFVPTISANEKETLSRPSSPLPTFSPSTSEGGTKVAHPNYTHSGENEDSNSETIKFFQGTCSSRFCIRCSVIRPGALVLVFKSG